MNDRRAESARRETIHFRNSLSTELTVNLEPWGEQHVIPSGDRFEIHALGPRNGHSIEIDIDTKFFTIYGWPSSVISMFHNGERLVGSGLPAPAALPRKRRIASTTASTKRFGPESEMRDLFRQINESLDANDRKFIAEELAAHEWAVALDLILFLAERQALPLTAEIRAKMYWLAGSVGINLEDRRQAWPKQR